VESNSQYSFSIDATLNSKIITKDIYLGVINNVLSDNFKIILLSFQISIGIAIILNLLLCAITNLAPQVVWNLINSLQFLILLTLLGVDFWEGKFVAILDYAFFKKIILRFFVIGLRLCEIFSKIEENF
jgi:hypothetical protein